MRRGNITAFMKGTGKMPDSNMTAQEDIASTFKKMIENVERNHATRVRNLNTRLKCEQFDTVFNKKANACDPRSLIRRTSKWYLNCLRWQLRRMQFLFMIISILGQAPCLLAMSSDCLPLKPCCFALSTWHYGMWVKAHMQNNINILNFLF